MKKVLSLLLVMIMALTVMLVVIPPIEASAATTYSLLWPVKNGQVSGYYYQGSHNGVDIVSAGDDTIYAARAGKVIWCENPCPHWDSWDSVNGVWRKDCSHYNTYGNVIAIQHDDGTVAIYGHLKQDSFKVSQNSTVVAGQPLALMGSSGMSDGKHLHFELRTLGSSWGYVNGEKINSNPVSKGGTVNYYYSGYGGTLSITPATITEGRYYLKNGNYRVYMVKDATGADTIAASTGSVSDKFLFTIEKEDPNYKITPILTANDYVLNCYWGKGGSQTLSGNEISLWLNDGDWSERWVFEEYGAGYLIHPADRPDLSITREDVKLYVEETTKSESQIWTLEPYCDHSYTYKSNSSGHWKECVQCGEKQTASSHTYTNDCDKSCNTCGYTRTTSHTYSNSCDTSCNVCGYTRTTTHTYTNSCDKTCNVCGSTRTITHTYNHDCDTDCNVCGETRTTTHSYGSYSCDSDHHWKTCTICNSSVISQPQYYTNNCDTSCNACGYERTITHSYDNDCDTDCNICGETRSTEHIYDNEQDTTCNVCSEVRTVDTDETEPSTKPGDKPDTDDTQSSSNKKDNNNDEDDEDEDNDNITIIVVAIAGAVTVSAVSIFGTALVMKKKK